MLTQAEETCIGSNGLGVQAQPSLARGFVEGGTDIGLNKEAIAGDHPGIEQPASWRRIPKEQAFAILRRITI